MKRNLLPFSLALTIFCIPLPLDADWVLLKDGSQVHGKVLRETDREVTLISEAGGKITFNMKKVVKVHVNNPTQPSRNTEEKSQKSSMALNRVILHKLKEAKDPAVSKERRFGECLLTIPGNFQLLQGSTFSKSYEGELLGQMVEEGSGAQLLVAAGGFPFKTTNFDEMAAALRFFLTQKEGFTLRTFQKTEMDDKPTVYAEFTRVDPRTNGSQRVLQGWVLLGRSHIYSVMLRVSEKAFRQNPIHYRNIVESFHTTPAQPTSRPR
ncbi:MAG: hypothetical protein V3T77_09730 [Planctomycetota bacterium]